MATWNGSSLSKKHAAQRIARTRGVMDALAITPGPHQPGCLKGKELDRHVEVIFNEYVAQHELEKPGKESELAALLQDIRLRETHRGSFLLYHPAHVLRWPELIEEIPLHELSAQIERSIFVFDFEMTEYYGLPVPEDSGLFNAQDARYLMGILQERLNDRRKGTLSNENQEKIARLEAAILELRELGEPAPQRNKSLPPNTPALQKSGSVPSTSASALPADPRAALWVSLQLGDFTVSKLDRLLVSLGLLRDAETCQLTNEAKGSVWIGIIEALRERKQVRRGNNAAVYEALQGSYPEIGVKKRTIQTPYQETNELARFYYGRALAFL